MSLRSLTEPQVVNADPAQDASAIPDRSHYSLDYLLDGRVFSYAHQIDTVLRLAPRTVLEVGVGPGLVAAALRALGITVTTLDVQQNLNPDLLGSVTDIPLDEASCDVALCCQVLEHLPYPCFVPALRELRRVTTSGLVLSLPDVTGFYQVSLKLPKLGSHAWVLPGFGRHERAIPPEQFARDGHHWEIGYTGTTPADVRTDIARAGWTIAKEWRVPEMPYHRFFDLRRTTAADAR